jgi:hypothetical protein
MEEPDRTVFLARHTNPTNPTPPGNEPSHLRWDFLPIATRITLARHSIWQQSGVTHIIGEMLASADRITGSYIG